MRFIIKYFNPCSVSNFIVNIDSVFSSNLLIFICIVV